jgi:hypothetical protein
MRVAATASRAGKRAARDARVTLANGALLLYHSFFRAA